MFAVACTLDSVISLPYSEKVNPALLGTWTDPNAEEESEMVISQHGPKEYKITVEAGEFIGHTSKVGEVNYMDVHELGDKLHMFFKYEHKGDTITFYEVSDDYKEVEFKTTTLLLNYLKENADKEGFFSNPETVQKKKSKK